MQRARTSNGEYTQHLDYPLLRLRRTRSDCVAIIREAGIPVPPKSSCFFCPFHSNAAWQRMREDEPYLFAKAVDLEAILNARRRALDRDPVYFHNRLKPLAMATTPNRQGRLFESEQEDTCESGFCMV